MTEATHCSQPSKSSLVTSAPATLHCLTGCVIGEVAGLMIAVTLELPPGFWTPRR